MAPFMLRLQKGRSSRVRAGHPWVYSNEIDMTQEAKALPPGSAVSLVDAGGEKLGVGYFNPHTLIAVRVLDRAADATLDAGWVGQRIRRALGLRQRLYDQPYYRLIHAEADGLPGLVIDRFGDVVVAQSNTAGIDRLQPLLLEALAETLAPRAIVWDRSSPVRGLEGLPIAEPELVSGALDGPVELIENGARFLADPRAGQKTGWFFDQRDNRAFLAGLAVCRSLRGGAGSGPPGGQAERRRRALPFREGRGLRQIGRPGRRRRTLRFGDRRSARLRQKQEGFGERPQGLPQIGQAGFRPGGAGWGAVHGVLFAPCDGRGLPRGSPPRAGR